MPRVEAGKGNQMFTGIVEYLGTVASLERGRLAVDTEAVAASGVGDSVAVAGCCLTITELTRSGFVADLSEETLLRTRLGRLVAGDRVNIEMPLTLGDPLGGHLVQGHVDSIAKVLSPVPALTIEVPESLRRYIVEKGSVAVDGVSLTVAELLPTGFISAIIPHTAEVTTLGALSAGDPVNLEVDVMARYAESLLAGVGR